MTNAFWRIRGYATFMKNLDQRIRNLEDLRRLIQDPDLREFLPSSNREAQLAEALEVLLHVVETRHLESCYFAIAARYPEMEIPPDNAECSCGLTTAVAQARLALATEAVVET